MGGMGIMGVFCRMGGFGFYGFSCTFAFTMDLLYRFSALVLCCVGALFSWGASRGAVIDSLMVVLDDVIEHRDGFLEAKLQRIDSLRRCVGMAGDDGRARFGALNDMFREFHSFNTDSAYAISIEEELLARDLADEGLLFNARLNRAEILAGVGMYHEALEVLDDVRVDVLPDYLRPYYYHIMRTLYGNMADYAAFDEVRGRYMEITDCYRDSVLMMNDSEGLVYNMVKADQLNVHGRHEEAVELLSMMLEDGGLSEHDRAICAWTLSVSYGQLGNDEERKRMLLVSAIGDMRSPVREYVSLRELARILYNEGDLDRAYRLMAIAVDDAAKCNARQRIVELNACYPEINEMYVETVREQKRSLMRTVVVITVLSVLLVALLFYTRRQMVRIGRARALLQETNARLLEANNAIAENSELKEVYIGRYMDQCMAYIDKLDSYRKSVGRVFNQGKPDELKRMLKSTDVVDNELKMFYDQFDRTFLSLFPDFVEDFNALLLPHEAIVPKRPGSLTTELRIFALIRLGIADSDKIARFLRYSLTTIYNYRTKVRNKARGDRNMLEAEVLKIGRQRRASD